jgi:hypothetical protein
MVDAPSRLSFETVVRTNWDKDYIEKRREFLLLRKAGLDRYAADSSTVPDAERQEYLKNQAAIQAILNDRESMAIAIRRGIIDEEYLFRYMRSGVLSDWAAASALVAALRRGNPNLFLEFEGLATQWEQGRSYYKQDNKLPVLRRVVSVR